MKERFYMKMKNKVIKIYSDFDFEEGLVKIERVIWKNPKRSDQISQNWRYYAHLKSFKRLRDANNNLLISQVWWKSEKRDNELQWNSSSSSWLLPSHKDAIRKPVRYIEYQAILWIKLWPAKIGKLCDKLSLEWWDVARTME